MQLSSRGPNAGFFQGLMSFIVVYKQTHRNACIFECVMHSVRRAPKSRGETHLRGFHKVKLRKVELGSTLPASNSRKR